MSGQHTLVTFPYTLSKLALCAEQRDAGAAPLPGVWGPVLSDVEGVSPQLYNLSGRVGGKIDAAFCALKLRWDTPVGRSL